MMFAIERIGDRFNPCIVCDKCRKKLLVGNGMFIWNDKCEVKTVCKVSCDDENFKMGVTLEQFLYDVVINCKAGIIRQAKSSIWKK